MRIEQSYISKSLAGLEDKFRKKYSLTDYVDSNSPVAIFGMYRNEDIEMLSNHRSEAIVIWQGMDARNINPKWVNILKNKVHEHYAISHWISDSLKKHGLKHKILPISATIPSDQLKSCPRGDSVYIYSSDLSIESGRYHGDHFIKEIRRRTKLNVIRATLQSYSWVELIEVYKKCFINLRLTPHDGCPNTNLEMGLMGRRSVFNGDLPHSIKWKGIDDICGSIISEYKIRHENNSRISEDIRNFVEIGNDFLNT